MTATDAVEWHDAIAQSFHHGYARSPRFVERLDLWRTAITAAVAPGDRVLDAGCGSGIFSLEAAARGATVDAIDGSPAMIAIGRAQQADLGIEKVNFQTALLADLRAWPAATYDVVMSSSVLEYLPDLEAELASLVRLMKPGGRLLISMPNAASWYRWGERLAFRLTGRPRYYAHVKRLATVGEIETILSKHGITIISDHYYADPPMLSRLLALLPLRRRKTLFLTVGRKSDRP